MDRPFFIRAPAKINLGLSILRRRTDGYHDLESVMQQVSLADTLLFEPLPNEDWYFFCTDPELSGKENLVYRAAALLKEQSGKVLPGVRITLFKNIPVEAGLAGGSSDAAAALLGLNRCWQLGFDKADLMETAALLGSDVPYCLHGGTVLTRGRGDKLEKLPDLPFFWVVLALPRGVNISTAAAYNSFDRELLGKPEIRPLVDAIQRSSKKEIIKWLARDLTNTLETSILPGFAKVEELRSKLREIGLNPALSGSGPTLFMIFDNYNLARSVTYAVEEQNGRAYLCWTITGDEEWLYV